MSDGTGSYDANYSGYVQWQQDEQQRYDQILNEMDSMPPEIALIMLMAFLGNYTEEQTSWVSLEQTYLGEALTAVSKLNAAFGAEADGYNDSTSIQDGINAGDNLYDHAYNISQGPSGNPFYSISSDVVAQLEVIYPSGWEGFETSPHDPTTPTTDDYTALEKYWSGVWLEAGTGDTGPLTAINTAFSNLDSTLGGENSQVQAQVQFDQQSLKQYLGSEKQVMSAWINQIQFANQAMQSAGS